MSKWPGLGDRIKERLLLLGYSVNGKPDIMRFCDERRYRHGYFYKWANRDVTPEPENLERLARDLGVTPEWLLFGPVIYERNALPDPRPLAPAAGRRSGRRARPTPIRGGSGTSLPPPEPEASSTPGVPPAPRALPVRRGMPRSGRNQDAILLIGRQPSIGGGRLDVWPQAA